MSVKSKLSTGFHAEGSKISETMHGECQTERNTGDSSQGYINIHDSSVLRGGSAGELRLQLGEDRRRELVELAGGQRDPVTFGESEHCGLGLVPDDVVELEDAVVVHQ